MDTLIRCEHLKKTYRNGVTAVQDFTAQFVSGAFYPVSYTHLDVYKRQGRERDIIIIKLK